MEEISLTFKQRKLILKHSVYKVLMHKLLYSPIPPLYFLKIHINIIIRFVHRLS
jgi:hypothetical protein